jgi:nanoRNase/pAp phosphatase (c-di-AMP/oligoRNAs hydrolase)
MARRIPAPRPVTPKRRPAGAAPAAAGTPRTAVARAALANAAAAGIASGWPTETVKSPPRFPLEAALDRISNTRRLLIYMHDNPDPDALAAASGLKRLVEHEVGAEVTLALGGIVGRAENRAMVEALRIPLTPMEELSLARFDRLAIVDSQPGTGNNSLPSKRRIDIVVDHHPIRSESAAAPWSDVRSELGATSTIVLEYLRDRRVPIDSRLATGLFYALRSETRDLGREATDAERDAYLFLVPLVDHKTLSRISHPKVPREHFTALDRALRSARVFGTVVTANLGELSYPDLVAEIADLLLGFDAAKFVLCGGRFGTKAFFSLRTDASESRAGTLMREIIDTRGAAGGHGTMAGGRLHAPVEDDAQLAAEFDLIVGRLLAAVGAPKDLSLPLVER